MKRTITLFAIIIALSVSTLAQKYEPSILYSNLLGNIKIQDDGRLKLLTLTGVFLNADKGTLRISLDGNEIAKYSFIVSPSNKPFSQVTNFMLMKNGAMDPRGLKLTKGGKYTFTYEANGKPFQRFSFDVKKKNVGTKYKSKYVWTKEGDWSKYSYLLIDKRYGGTLQFKYYVRSDVFTNDCMSQAFLKRDSDSKLIAKTINVSCSRSPNWKRTNQPFRTPKKRPESPGSSRLTDRFEFNNYAFKDGGYTIEHELNGKLHATYKFKVKGGKIQRQDRQVRGSSDHLDYMDGGGTVFWLKKQ